MDMTLESMVRVKLFFFKIDLVAHKAKSFLLLLMGNVHVKHNDILWFVDYKERFD